MLRATAGLIPSLHETTYYINKFGEGAENKLTRGISGGPGTEMKQMKLT